jgi:proton-translocating NADH-quinone oxidoreductase chain N
LNNLVLLLPEIIITLVAFTIITLDLSWKNERRSATILPWLAFAGAITTLLAAIYVWFYTGGQPMPVGQVGAMPMMAADPLALFFTLLAALIVALVSLSALDYINTRTPFRGEFYALTMLAGLSLMLLSASTNLVMIYLSLEFLSISSYILTGFLRRDARSIEAAMKYFLYGALASGVMLYGFSLFYGMTGSVDLATIAASLSASPPNGLVVVFAVLLMLAGFGFKIALVPFHQWSPDAYEGAPTPVTAFLSVGPKAAGFAVLIRVLVVALPAYTLSWTAILTVIAVLTMTLGNLVALWQKDMKRMLAYSSIAQAGYILVGLAAWTATGPDRWGGGVSAMMFFLFAYVFTNLGAFAVAIAVENKTGSSNISAYAGLIRRSPFMAVALLVFFLSLIGIPPTGGFMGKLLVFGAAIDRQLYVLAAFGIFNSVISVYYYFGITRLSFFDHAQDESPIKPGWAIGSVIVVALVMTLVLALYAQPFIKLAVDSATILAATYQD